MVSGLFSSPKLAAAAAQPAPAAPETPTLASAAVNSPAENQVGQLASAYGIGSTVLTSGLGAQDQLNVQRKILLGGP